MQHPQCLVLGPLLLAADVEQPLPDAARVHTAGVPPVLPHVAPVRAVRRGTMRYSQGGTMQLQKHAW